MPLSEQEQTQILTAYHKNPDAMERLVDALLILREYDAYDLAFIELLKQMTEEERKLILAELRKKG